MTPLVKKLSQYIFFLSVIIHFGACPEEDAHCRLTLEPPIFNGTYGSEEEEVFNLFKPHSDVPLPLAIVIHQGAFITGSKDDLLLRKMSDDLARCGVAAAPINYRLLTPNNLGNGAVRTVQAVGDVFEGENTIRKEYYHAIQDVRAAIRHFRKNAVSYNIDPNQIYLIGYSTGAMLALHAAFVDDYEAQNIYFGKVIVENQGNLDARGDAKNSDVSATVKGVLSINGAVFDPNFITDQDTTPLLLAYGTNDKMILPGRGKPFEKYIKDTKVDLPSFLFEMGITEKKDRRNTESKTYNGVKLSVLIPNEVPALLRNIFTSELHGSKIIYDLRKGKRTKTFIVEGGGHNFLLDEDGMTTKDYAKLHNEIIKFINPLTPTSPRRVRH